MKTTGRFLKSSYGCFVGRQITFTLPTFTFFTLAQCDRPCLNGGFCASRNHCQCRSGFHGDQCEKGQDDYFIEFTTVYHLQEVSGKSGWKVLFGSFRWEIFESNGTSCFPGRNRDFKIQRRGRRRKRHKNNRFYNQNINFALVSRSFVHFFTRFCTTTT